AQAHEKNAKERLRRFENVSKKGTDKSIQEKIKRRSVSVFEPRPEYNHATNALCVIGRRELTQSLFLDRRSFLSSYDYRSDLEGELLLPMIRALSPVCGGINLEYYFSRVDNQKLGSGSKLPHNVIGLIGVSNGVEGDLRTGLPSQMVEIHDPIRMCMIVEHYPDVVLSCLQKDTNVMEWYKNEWMHLLVIHPESKRVFRLNTCRFEEHEFEILPIANKPDIPNGIEWTELSGNINPFTF
ncbi:MAG TPA: putative inorganic carbon transporter subunit DabA, partial [Bacteroidia bacterium]